MRSASPTMTTILLLRSWPPTRRIDAARRRIWLKNCGVGLIGTWISQSSSSSSSLFPFASTRGTYPHHRDRGRIRLAWRRYSRLPMALAKWLRNKDERETTGDAESTPTGDTGSRLDHRGAVGGLWD